MSQHQILNPADHGELRIHTEAGAEYGDNVMACLAMPAEFREVQAHYPIVFRRDAETGKLAALMAQGHLARIYMVLASLAQFGNLVARKNRKVALG